MNAPLAALAGLLLTTTQAAAADTAPLSPSSSSSVDVTGHIGGTGGDGYAGALLGASVLARSGVLGGGATIEASGAFATRFGAGALGGFSYRNDNGFGVDLLGVLGVHHYEGVGRGILSSDPGVSGTTPFAGGRSRLSYQLGSGARRFQFGGTATLESDLLRDTKRSTYTSTGWFSGDTSTRTDTHDVGFATVGLMLDAGVTFF